MSEDPKKGGVPPKKSDTFDIELLWVDPALGDGITGSTFHNVIVDKPRNFFRVCPELAYRRRTELYTHKIEGVIGETHYIVAPPMRGVIEEAVPCTLVVCVYRDGTPRLWPIKFPRDGERDNGAWISARSCARIAMEKWVKLVWSGGSYMTRDAQPGYAPEPDYSKLPPFDDLVRTAFGEGGIIADRNHPIYRELFGVAPKRDLDDGDEL